MKTTIKELKETIKIEDLRKDNEFNLSDIQLIQSELYMIIWRKIKNLSIQKDFKEYRKGIELNSTYSFYFDNNEILNTLRQLYINTKNSFIKEVIKTVGENKKFTEKQIQIIIDEMIKFNLTINF